MIFFFTRIPWSCDDFFFSNAQIVLQDNTASRITTDTIKINALLDLYQESLNKSDYTQASQYIQEVCTLSKEINYQKGLFACHNNKGLLHQNQGQYDEALNDFQIALDIANKTGVKNFIADVYTNMGLVFDSKGDLPEAKKHYLMALSIRDKSELRDISAAYTNLGIVAYKQGDIAGSLTYFLKSLETDEQLGNKQDIALSKNNVGLFYQHQGDYEKALQYLNEANQLSQELGDKRTNAGTNVNIANIYEKKGKLQEASQCLAKSLTLFEEIGDKAAIAETSTGLANIHIQLAQYEQAGQYLEISQEVNKEIGNEIGLGVSYVNLGFLHTQLKNFETAGTYYELAAKQFRKAGALEGLSQVYYKHAQLDSMTGNYNAAYNHFKLYALYQDSLVQISNQALLLDAQHKYETAKKDEAIIKLENEKSISKISLDVQSEKLRRLESENQLKQNKIALLAKDKTLQQLEIDKSKASAATQKAELEKNKNQVALLSVQSQLQQSEIQKQRALKNYFIGGLILFGLLSFFTYNYYSVRQKLKLQTLRNKIAADLHDEVGSTLSSIAIFSEIAQQQSQEVNPMLHTIRESSRKMLDAMGDIVWTINPDNDQFEKIITRMRNFAFELLGARKIDFEFNADEDVVNLRLPMEVRKNLYLIFKEAANNLVKYSGANKAEFLVHEETGKLTMMIRDNGVGFDPDKLTEGNGLKSMRKRAAEIGALLKIESSPGTGTLIQLRLAI